MSTEGAPPGLIGPFVGAAGEGAVRVVLALPGRDEPRLRCRLELEGEAKELEAEPSHGDFRVFLFPFDALPPGAEARYRFETEAGPLDLEGLGPDDCRFTVPGPLGEEDLVALTSCHRPDAQLPLGGSYESAEAPWRDLRALVDAGEPLRLLLLGGDQLYNDALERELLSVLDSDEDLPSLRSALIESYRRQWGGLEYRRALARIPSLAIWDDHDITDGWGSRPEQFEGEQIRPRWRRYFGLCREAFAALQASRNPPPLLEGPGAPFTTRLDLGDLRLLLLDLRSERNAAAGRLWAGEHEAAALAELAPGAGPRATLVLSPVVAFRTNPERDRRLGRWTRALFAVTRWWELRRWLRRGWALGGLGWLAGAFAVPLLTPVLLLWLLAGAIPELLLRVPFLPHLTDDLDDGLTADPNRPSLRRLLDALVRRRREHGPVALLGGDVHLQGVAELIDGTGDDAVSLLQIVSSPITNAPMEKVAAGFTTTTSPIVPDESRPERRARNVAWWSRRGFALVRPAGLEDGASGPSVLFHLEGHEEPIALPGSFVAPRAGRDRTQVGPSES